MATQPMRILFDANSLMVQRTGVGHYTAGLIASMAASNPKTQFIGYYYNFLGHKRPPLSPIANNIYYRAIYWFPGPLVNLLRRLHIEVPIEILTAFRADFILYPNFLSQPSLRKTPNAPIIHDLMYYDLPAYGSDKSVRDLTKFVPRTLQRASFVITVSDFSKGRIHDVYGIPDANILKTFIPPVEAATLNPSIANKLVAKQGISKPYLLFIGTLEPRKNLGNLLDAYVLLPPKLQRSYSLVLAGKIDWKYQETKQKLEAMQKAGRDIHYLGYVDNNTRAALYQNARLSVLPSHYEGFGMQTLEAMRYGTPSAVSDIPVLRETGGAMVTYFNHIDPIDIARVVASCLTTKPPKKQLLQDYLASQMDWNEVGNLVMERIKQAIERKAL